MGQVYQAAQRRIDVQLWGPLPPTIRRVVNKPVQRVKGSCFAWGFDGRWGQGPPQPLANEGVSTPLDGRGSWDGGSMATRWGRGPKGHRGGSCFCMGWGQGAPTALPPTAPTTRSTLGGRGPHSRTPVRPGQRRGGLVTEKASPSRGEKSSKKVTC